MDKTSTEQSLLQGKEIEFHTKKNASDSESMTCSLQATHGQFELIYLPCEQNFVSGFELPLENSNCNENPLSLKENKVKGNEQNYLNTSTNLATYGLIFDNDGALNLTTTPSNEENAISKYQNKNDSNNIQFVCKQNDVLLPYLSYPKMWGDRLNFLSISLPGVNENTDAPEFIDISDVPVIFANSDYQNKTKENEDQTTMQIKRNFVGSNTATENYQKISSDDDDVIFVAEYTETLPAVDKGNKTEPKQINKRTRKRTNLVAERKNPKRLARFSKASESLALKLAIPPRVFNAKVTRNKQKTCNAEYQSKGFKTTTRTTVNSKSVCYLGKNDFKEWPIEGLHERPEYNETTDSIEKFDYTIRNIQDSQLINNTFNVTKQVAGKKCIRGKRCGRGNKRSITSHRKVQNKSFKPITVKLNESVELQTLTHETFHECLNYVLQVKKLNKIFEKQDETNRNDNLEQAVDILTDNCILYGIVNDIDQDDIAHYISITKKNYLKEENVCKEDK